MWDPAAYTPTTTPRLRRMFHDETQDVGTDLFDCPGQAEGVKQVDIQAYDHATEVWSNTVTVTACTAVY